MDAMTHAADTDPADETRADEADMSRTAARVRLIAFAVVVVGATAALAATGGLSRAGVETFVEDAGAWGPVVYVLAYAILTVAFFPVSIVTVVGGALFGSVLGTMLTVVGATIGALGSFLIGRRIGRRSVEALAGERVAAIDGWLTRRGFVAILYARLLPIFPFNALNYIAGVTGLRLRDYAVGTFVGIIPGTFAFSALGGNLDDRTSPQFLGSVALIVLLLILGPILAKRFGPDQDARLGGDDQAG